MESKKFALLVVAMAAVLLIVGAPTVAAARNRIKPFSIITDAVFYAESCVAEGYPCTGNSQCCQGKCSYMPNPLGDGVWLCFNT
ncbi:hypothetical protein V6N13_085996 [Hibiscus sabdariffa]